MKYEAIASCSREFSVRKMCKALGLRAENYYRFRRRRRNREKREEEERETAAVIRQVFLENRRVYVYRRMRQSLEKKEIYLSEYRIRQIMRKTGLYPLSRKRYRPGKSLTVRLPYEENELGQSFVSESPGKVLAGDITYIRTYLGWVYLAIVIDLYNREVIGYAVSQSIDAELVKR